MRLPRIVPIRCGLLGAIILTVGAATAQQLNCPPMPDLAQVNHDFRGEVRGEIDALGKVKVGEIGGKAEVVAKNLFEKYPNIDKLVVVQMMAATYCSMLRDSKTLKDSEKNRLWLAFSDRVFKFVSPAYKPPPTAVPKPQGNNQPANDGKTPMTQECAAGANCAQSNGQTGGITAGQIVIGKVPLHIAPEQIAALTAYLLAVKDNAQNIKIVISADQDSREPLVDELYDIFKNAQWPMGNDGAFHTVLFTDQKVFRGATIKLHGEVSKTGRATVSPPDPAYYVAAVLTKLNTPVQLNHTPDNKAGIIGIHFSGGFDTGQP